MRDSPFYPSGYCARISPPEATFPAKFLHRFRNLFECRDSLAFRATQTSFSWDSLERSKKWLYPILQCNLPVPLVILAVSKSGPLERFF